MQRRVREHDVIGGGLPRRDVALFEATAGAGERSRAIEHARRAVDPYRLGCVQAAVQFLGELTGSAPEIDDPTTGTRLDEGHEIPERSSAFGLEALVLIRVPLRRARTRHAAPPPFRGSMQPMGILPDSGRVAERLDHEVMGWLTTVTANGRPQSSAVWFVARDDAIYVQSQRE